MPFTNREQISQFAPNFMIKTPTSCQFRNKEEHHEYDRFLNHLNSIHPSDKAVVGDCWNYYGVIDGKIAYFDDLQNIDEHFTRIDLKNWQQVFVEYGDNILVSDDKIGWCEELFITFVPQSDYPIYADDSQDRSMIQGWKYAKPIIPEKEEEDCLNGKVVEIEGKEYELKKVE